MTNSLSSEKKKKIDGKKKKVEKDVLVTDLMAGPKKGEVIPVWVKSSPIVAMDDSVSLQNPSQDFTLEQAEQVLAIQDENLRLHEMIFGKTNPQTVALAERVVKLCNSQGSFLLGLGDTKTSLVLFKKASEVLGRMPPSAGDYATKLELRCLTYSNLAWYYFCTKEYYPALQFAQKAQSSANVSQDQRAMAAAHLNIGCCISMLGCHDGALDHATKALYLLQAERGGSGSNSAVAVCLHNVAVEQILLFRAGEHINSGEALETCTDAIEIAKEVLDPTHPWMRHFRRTFKIAVKMAPAVEALRRSPLGPLKRAKSAAPSLFLETPKGRALKLQMEHQHPQYDADEAYNKPGLLPPVNGAISLPLLSSMLPSQSPQQQPHSDPPLKRVGNKMPTGKLPQLPTNLSQPHAFNPVGGHIKHRYPDDDDGEDERRKKENADREEGEPKSRSAILGLGKTAMLGYKALEPGSDLSKLILKRKEMIEKADNIKDIPRIMPTDAEDDIKITASSSADVVSGMSIVDSVDVLSETSPMESSTCDPNEEDYYDDEFEATSPGGVNRKYSQEDEAAAVGKLQNLARGRQARKEAAEKKKAMGGTVMISPKLGQTKAEAGKAAGGKRNQVRTTSRVLTDEDREQATLKLQALARGKATRKIIDSKKEEYSKDPSLMPMGYKQFSECSDASNPYFTTLATGKKAKKAAETAQNMYGEQDYTYTHKKAALALQKAARGKEARAKVAIKKEALGGKVEISPKLGQTKYEAGKAKPK